MERSLRGVLPVAKGAARTEQGNLSREFGGYEFLCRSLCRVGSVSGSLYLTKHHWGSRRAE